MLVGQNPGRKEDETGQPFVGMAGRYLNKTLEKYGIDRQKLFITSVVKHKSPDNRKPRQDEIEACLPFRLEQFKRVKPKTIVLMGTIAWEIPRDYDAEYIETYHPAAAMRFPKIRKRFENEFRKLKDKA